MLPISLLLGAHTGWAWDIGHAEYYQTISVTYPKGLFFKADGTELYTVTSGADVVQYTLSTPWDISSASHTRDFDVSVKTTAPMGVFFKPDGTEMYIVEAVSANNIIQYTLSTAWNISSATYTRTLDISAASTGLSGIFFKSDGSEMYISRYSSGNESIIQYSLSTDWDISSATYIRTLDISADCDSPMDLFLRFDGGAMYIVDGASDQVSQYTLSTPWDISSASHTRDFDVSVKTTAPGGLFFKTNGESMYVCGSSELGIYQYEM